MWNQGALWKLRMGHRLQWGSPARHRPLNFAIWKMGGICLSNSLQRQILRGIPMLPAWPSLVTGARRGHPSNQDLDFNREPTQGSRRTGRAAVGQEMEMLSDVYFYRHPGGRGWLAGQHPHCYFHYCCLSSHGFHGHLDRDGERASCFETPRCYHRWLTSY